MDLTNKIASTHLGQKSNGSEYYDPSLLVAIPRTNNRKQYDIENQNLPFAGYDVWQAYEFSALTKRGVPVTRMLKIRYSCENEFLIESKSLKLYLNSFNMSRFGDTVQECLQICKEKIKQDLNEKLQTNVDLNYISNNAERKNIFEKFINIMELIDESKVEISSFKESPEVLKTTDTKKIKVYRIMFDSLRSNCRVTHQPDFGDLFIYYESEKRIDEMSLLQYLTSFRSEYHFHEECCEMIFKRLADILNNNDKLFVTALYTRRGGIDISPSRWSKNCNIEELEPLLDLACYARNGVKQ